mmetsp:Transcript_33361/g.76121  ORF Transcript_33361/g.76121 Transcript_33361/m.76121 type:complete len:561 (-) Transcript_33361:49-1731(-)
MEDVLKTAVKESGGESNHVELSKVKADAKVRSYFRRALFKPPWDDQTFKVYFQSRPNVWDFDEQTGGVRLQTDLTRQISEAMHKRRKSAPFPEALYTATLKSASPQETVSVISKAGPGDMAALPLDAVEALIGSLGNAQTSADPNFANAFVTAQQHVLAAVPGALEKKDATLQQYMEFFMHVFKFGGEQVDPRVAAQKVATLKEICESAATVIREKGLGTVGPKGLMPLCQMAPFHVMALAVSHLGEKGEGDDVKACAEGLKNVPATVLEGLAEETLVQLVVAGTKSAAVAETVVPLACKAAAATLPGWDVEDITKLLLAASKAKACKDAQEVTELFGRAAEALSPQLGSLSDTQLIKVAFTLCRVPACKDFMETLGNEAVNRLPKVPPPQLLLLTQGLLSLGGEHEVVKKVVEQWASSLAEVKLTADQFAKLAQHIAPLLPGHTEFWTRLGARLVAEHGAFTDAGWTSVEAAFPGGEGPAFEEKEKLIAALAAKKKKDAKDKEQKESKENDRKRSRSRDRNDRRRDDGRDKGRDRRRSRSRSRGKDRRSRSRSRDRRRR